MHAGVLGHTGKGMSYMVLPMLGLQGVLTHGSSGKMVEVSYCYDSVTGLFADGVYKVGLILGERSLLCILSLKGRA